MKLNKLIVLVVLFQLVGCASIQPSTPIAQDALRNGISVDRSFPEALPDKSVQIPGAQVLLITSESAAGLLMPIPFVSETVGKVMDNLAADGLAAKYKAIDPYALALRSLQTNPHYRPLGADTHLYPFLAIQECADDRFRLQLVYHVKSPQWVGRYTYHLRTTYTADEFNNPTSAVLTTIQAELIEGTTFLYSLLERAERGELVSRGTQVEIGSLHLIGGKAMGLLSPTALNPKQVDLIEETPDHVLVRLNGNMSAPASIGGLLFGVHYLRKDQLQTFKITQ